MGDFITHNYPAILSMILGYALIIWSLIISHNAGDETFKKITFFAAIPIAVLVSGLGFYKIYQDSIQSKVEMAQIQNTQLSLSELGQKTLQLHDETFQISNTLSKEAKVLSDETSRSMQLSDTIESLQQNVSNINDYIQTSSAQLDNLSNLTAQMIDTDNQNSAQVTQSIQDAQATISQIAAANNAESEQLNSQLEQLQNNIQDQTSGPSFRNYALRNYSNPACGIERLPFPIC